MVLSMEILEKDAMHVNPLKEVTSNIRFVQPVNKSITAALSARKQIGRQDTRRDARNYRRIYQRIRSERVLYVLNR